MKQTKLLIKEIYPAAIMKVPKLGTYFRIALYGRTKTGVEKMVLKSVLLVGDPDFDGSDFLPVWEFSSQDLIKFFVKSGWNPVRFVYPPEPDIVPQRAKPWKPAIKEKQ